LRQQDKIIVWPAYFDAAGTRKDGRRLPKDLTVSVPKTSEIREAALKIGYACEIVADSGYSKTPWSKPGMLLIRKREPKDQMLRKIAKHLQISRSAQSQQSKA
jgi:signal recognition particle subunit SRP19